MPPKKGGSSVGVVLGAGCALLLVLVAVAAVGVYVVVRGRDGGSAPDTPPQASGPQTVSARDLRDFTGTRGQVVFVSELVNTGNAPVVPSARLRLLDARKLEVASVPCAIPARQLGPGEKHPCVFTYSGARKSFASSDVAVDTRPATGREARLLVQGTTLGRGGAGHQVAGTVQNPTSLTVRSTVVVVTLYGSDGRIVGGGSLDLPRDLPPNGKAPFAVGIADAAALPKTFAVRAIGSPD